MDTCQFETIIKARVSQLKYSDDTVEELTMPWAERYSRGTTLMGAFVLKLLEACQNTKKMCSLMRLSWHTVNAIMAKGVERGMARRQLEPIAHLGLDEKSTERGHSYVSILTDLDRSHVLDVVPGRKLESATELLHTLRSEQRLVAKAVSFCALNQLNLKTSRAWHIKENFSLYRPTVAAKHYFKSWSNSAVRSKLEPAKKVVKMLRRHEQGLLNYSVRRITNACAEGCNSAIQLIKANAEDFATLTTTEQRFCFIVVS